jgi:uncharacterized protein YqgC (DUF456 family)
METWLIPLLAWLVMLVGLAGVVLPVLPGLALIWAAALAYGLLAGWGSSGPWLFALITVLGLGGSLAEIWATGAGARLSGASLTSVLAGAALGLIGLFIGGPLAALAGLLGGVLLAEYGRLRDWRAAARATGGTAAGCGLSFGLKFVIGLLMIGAWVAWLLIG